MSEQIKAKAVEAPVRGQGVEAAGNGSSTPNIRDPSAFTSDVIEREKK